MSSGEEGFLGRIGEVLRDNWIALEIAGIVIGLLMLIFLVVLLVKLSGRKDAERGEQSEGFAQIQGQTASAPVMATKPEAAPELQPAAQTVSELRQDNLAGVLNSITDIGKLQMNNANHLKSIEIKIENAQVTINYDEESNQRNTFVSAGAQSGIAAPTEEVMQVDEEMQAVTAVPPETDRQAEAIAPEPTEPVNQPGQAEQTQLTAPEAAPAAMPEPETEPEPAPVSTPVSVPEERGIYFAPEEVTDFLDEDLTPANRQRKREEFIWNQAEHKDLRATTTADFLREARMHELAETGEDYFGSGDYRGEMDRGFGGGTAEDLYARPAQDRLSGMDQRLDQSELSGKSMGKRFGPENTNTTRSGRSYTEEELARQIKS